MPAPLSILIAFGLIAGLAIVLRWTYGSDATERRYRVHDEPTTPPVDEPADELDMLADGPPDGRHDALDPATADELLASTDPADEPFGLLRSVLVAADRPQAEAVRDVLGDAGIRATVAETGDGIRVLVFPEELDAARRLVR